MKILFVSQSADKTKTAITVRLDTANNFADSFPYQTHLFYENGHTELHSVSPTIEDAIWNHRLLCEKCYIRINV